jgi:hypothetical protein
LLSVVSFAKQSQKDIYDIVSSSIGRWQPHSSSGRLLARELFRDDFKQFWMIVARKLVFAGRYFQTALIASTWAGNDSGCMQDP